MSRLAKEICNVKISQGRGPGFPHPPLTHCGNRRLTVFFRERLRDRSRNYARCLRSREREHVEHASQLP